MDSSESPLLTAEEANSDLEGSQSGGRGVGYPEMQPDFKLL
jgi:hypothetical protein